MEWKLFISQNEGISSTVQRLQFNENYHGWNASFCEELTYPAKQEDFHANEGKEKVNSQITKSTLATIFAHFE